MTDIGMTRIQIRTVKENTQLYLVEETDPLRRVKYKIVNNLMTYILNDPDGVKGFVWSTDEDQKITEALKKAKKWDDIMKRSMEAPYIDCIENLKKLEAVNDWWLLFNQCIDSEGAKEKLKELLKDLKFEPGNIGKIIDEKPETWTNLVEAVEAAKTWAQKYKPPSRCFARLDQDPFIELEKLLEFKE